MRGLKLSPGAALVLEGDVSIDGLEIDGAAVFKAAPGVQLEVKDAKARPPRCSACLRYC